MLYQHTSTLPKACIEVKRFLERVESLDSIVATLRLPLRRFAFTEAVGRTYRNANHRDLVVGKPIRLG